MVRELMNDNKAVAAAMRKAHKLCDDHEDVATASLLRMYIDATEKRTGSCLNPRAKRRLRALGPGAC